MISAAEKMDLISRFRLKAWAHILKLQQTRGRVLNRNQIRCMEIALGVFEGQT